MVKRMGQTQPAKAIIEEIKNEIKNQEPSKTISIMTSALKINRIELLDANELDSNIYFFLLRLISAKGIEITTEDLVYNDNEFSNYLDRASYEISQTVLEKWVHQGIYN